MSGEEAGDRMLKEASALQDKAQDSLINTKQMIAQSKEVGMATLEELERQRGVIENINSEVNRVDDNLARAEKLDPAEEAKRTCTNWIREFIDNLNQLVEDREVEIERLMAGKGKKTNRHIIEEYNQYVVNHKFHVNKLEGIMRLVNNDVLDVELVDSVKEDLEYYLESYEDEDYQQAYDEDFFYEALGLDELDVATVFPSALRETHPPYVSPADGPSMSAPSGTH